MSENELRPLARELVDTARQAQTPSDAHRERAYQALLAGLGGAASVGAAKVAATTTKALGTGAFGWLKWAIATAVLASVGAGAYMWPGHRHGAPQPSAPVALAPIPSRAALAPTVSAPSVDPSALTGASAPPEPSAAPSLKSQALVKPSGGDLGEELSLLHQALAESRSGNAARALALARQHARQYPNSRLRVERDAIEVRSLCTLGRAAEAHKIAERLRSQEPRSPVSAALEETCVGK
jgi:hypothetical protein